MLELKQLTYVRGRKDLLRNITFSLKGGDLLWITGSNGSGKSTLVKLLVGILPWQTGSFLWRSQSLSPRNPSYLREVIYLGHQLGLKPKLSVLENLRAWLDLRGEPHQDLRKVFEQLGLKKNQTHSQSIEQLSQGQKCRAALARLCVAPNSALWILDEPFAGLDHSGLTLFKALCVQHLARRGMIIITSPGAGSGANPGASSTSSSAANTEKSNTEKLSLPLDFTQAGVFVQHLDLNPMNARVVNVNTFDTESNHKNSNKNSTITRTETCEVRTENCDV